MPARSGLWASKTCYPSTLQQHRRAVRLAGETPLANLCNRLVFTSTLEVTPFPSIGLSPSCPPRPLSCFRLGGSPALSPSHPRRRWLAIAGITSLGSATQLVPRWPAATSPSPLRGRAVSRAEARVGVVGPARARWSGSQTPHVATRSPCPASRAVPREPEPASPHPNQRMRLVEPEAPSTDKSHRRRPSSRPNSNRVGRHWYPGFATVGPASDMLSRSHPRSARPNCLPAVRRGPWATCRLPASAMECPPSTPTGRPIPGLERGKPRPTRWRRSSRNAARRASSGQGSLGFSTASTPTTTTARRSGFTPT
jgi:hypothetical protein